MCLNKRTEVNRLSSAHGCLEGDSSEACNYRPISLTCTMCKIMEVTVKDHVMKYLLSKGLISNK